MPSVSEVRPKIWEDVLDLFDNGEFSAIWGRRESMEMKIMLAIQIKVETLLGLANQSF